MAEEMGFGPWFEGQKEERSFVTSVSRIISGHSSVRSHLDGFRIFEDPMCVCVKGYETLDHLIWRCERFGSERHRLIDSNVVWTSLEVFKSGSDLTISLSVDVRLAICFNGP
jgi:hypothetical protein